MRRRSRRRAPPILKRRAEAGVRRITSHDARDTAGSGCAVMGAGQKIIGALLGHSDGASTERYTHIAPGRDDGNGRGTMAAAGRGCLSATGFSY
jgi:integrase